MFILQKFFTGANLTYGTGGMLILCQNSKVILPSCCKQTAVYNLELIFIPTRATNLCFPPGGYWCVYQAYFCWNSFHFRSHFDHQTCRSPQKKSALNFKTCPGINSHSIRLGHCRLFYCSPCLLTSVPSFGARLLMSSWAIDYTLESFVYFWQSGSMID